MPIPLKDRTVHKPLDNCINIFLTVDSHTVFKYFNQHDPAPLYRRQLNCEFQEYLQSAVAPGRPDSIVSFKIVCKKAADEKYVNPLLKSIRYYFEKKRTIKEQELMRFKSANYKLIFISLLFILLLQAVLPFILPNQEIFTNAILLFSWIILWRPVERLMIYPARSKKEIMLMRKIETAESVVVINEKEFVIDLKFIDAA